MNTAARLTAYGALAVLLGAGAFATGSAVDVPTDHLRPTAGSGAAGHGTGHGAVAGAGLDLRHDGRVRTAQFAVPTVESTPVPQPAPAAENGHTHAEGGHR